jgi:hypothetical protein
MHKTLGRLRSGEEEDFMINDSARPGPGALPRWVDINNVQNVPLEIRLRYAAIYFK